MAITFDNIAGGELAEKFTMALAQIGRNILDPNMDPIAARGMTINLKFKPGSRGPLISSLILRPNWLASRNPRRYSWLGRISTQDASRCPSTGATARRSHLLRRRQLRRTRKYGSQRHRHLTQQLGKFMRNPAKPLLI